MISKQTSRLLFLSKLPGVGASALNRLVERVSGEQATLAGLVDIVPRLATTLEDPRTLYLAQEKASAEIARALDLQIHVLSPADQAYPRALARTPDRPPLLYVKGHLSALDKPTIGVVGTRKPTADGIGMAEWISSFFVNAGWCVVSGLALGIDTIAHEAAVHLAGCTVAVLAHGLDQISPKRNAGLAERIVASGGALISEYPPGEPPYPSNFVKRDRIQAGISLGLIVVQTDITGGSLHASRAILEYGRPLAYPVPTKRDVENHEEKVQGILKLHTEASGEVSKFLRCPQDSLRRLLPLQTKEDFRTLSNMMKAPERTSPVKHALSLF